MSAAGRLTAAWYRAALTPATALGTPLSLAFGALAATRRALYGHGVLARHRMPVPVVVIGNITVGGAGKTPLVRALAAALRAGGHRPGIVSRGHGGRLAGPHLVGGGDTADDVGDEPLLLAADGTPVAIGRDRVAAARHLLAAHPDIDVVLADDGLQHYALARDVEVAVVDAARGLGNGWLLPAGPLREPASRLGRVDAIVLNASTSAADARIADPVPVDAAPGIPRFAMRLVPQPWRRVVDDAVVADPAPFPPGTVHAIAGIADPARFFDTLERLGIDFVPHAFADHHRYTGADLAWPGARAILMTEKDAVKCRRIGDDRMAWLPVHADIDAALVTLIEDRMHGSQAA